MNYKKIENRTIPQVSLKDGRHSVVLIFLVLSNLEGLQKAPCFTEHSLPSS